MASRNAMPRRELCYRQMKEIYDLSKLADRSVEDKLTFLASYPEVARLAEDFGAAHLKVIQDTKDDGFDREDQFRAQFDKMRRAIGGKYASFAQNRSDNAPSSNTSSKIKLPKISLPRFSGELSLWPSFFALFNTSIHNNDSLSNMEKYQYLLSSLSGEVLNVIKNLYLSAEHYLIAYDLLIERYQNERELATHYWHSIVRAKPLKSDSVQALRTLLDVFNENTRALQLMDFPVEAWDFILLVAMLDKLTPTLREKFEVEHRKTKIPQYSQLTAFLSEYCKVFASVSDSNTFAGKSSYRASKSGASVSFATKVRACSVCQEQHSVLQCPSFLSLSPKDRHARVKELALCFNCLRLGHGVESCTSKWRCRTCEAPHHTLLHFPRGSTSGSSGVLSPTTSDSNVAQSQEESVMSMASVSAPKQTVLLSTVRAEALNVYGQPFPVRILLDSASQSNFISEDCMQRGGFKRTGDRNIVVAVNGTRAAATRGSTSFIIQTRGDRKMRFPIEALILPRISTHLPSTRIQTKPWKHLEGLPLADAYFNKPGPVDILIGAAVFTSLLRNGHRVGGKDEPDALNTIFGWVLLGSVSSGVSQPLQSFLTLDSLDTVVNKFWQLEEVPSDTSYSEEDKRCEDLFVQTTRRERSGRFVVHYPFAQDKPCFVDSRQIAINRLRSLERRFRRNPELRLSYHQFMQDYLDSGHMERISQPFPTNGAVCYLPHHGVFKLDSTTTLSCESCLMHRQSALMGSR